VPYLIPSFLARPIPKFTNPARTCSDDVTANAKTHALPQLPSNPSPKVDGVAQTPPTFQLRKPTWHPSCPPQPRVAFRSRMHCCSVCWLVFAPPWAISFPHLTNSFAGVAPLISCISIVRGHLHALRQTLRHNELASFSTRCFISRWLAIGLCLSRNFSC
jgi:hypothetical protein